MGDDALIVHHDINLGIAVDLDNEGLIVPVVHNAEELNLRGMARRIRDLADRARTKRLSLDDITGGTFSITNAGPFGTLLTGAIINQPQVAILSTDGVARKPVVVELPDGTESIAIHSVGPGGMTFDHRAVDGAYVARVPGPAVGDPRRPRLGRRAVGRCAAATGAPSRPPMRVRWLGRVPYREAWDLQRALSRRSAEDYLLLLEHPSVYTLGATATSATCWSTRHRWEPTWSGPTGAVTSPITVPASWSATR